MAEYIERELIYGDFEKCNDNNPKWTPGRVKTLIARQPAADVAPVVHGEWVWKRFPIPWGDSDLDVYTVCSVCGCCSPGESNYCPNCGAKMDLEVIDNGQK